MTDQNVINDEWTEIPDQAPILKLDEGEIVVGSFVEARTVQLDDTENGGKRSARLYEIETAEGIFGVWGSHDLDRKLASVRVGDRVKIRFNGVEKLDGDRELKRYSVWLARR